MIKLLLKGVVGVSNFIVEAIEADEAEHRANPTRYMNDREKIEHFVEHDKYVVYKVEEEWWGGYQSGNRWVEEEVEYKYIFKGAYDTRQEARDNAGYRDEIGHGSVYLHY